MKIVQNCEEKQGNKVKKIKKQVVQLRNNAVFGKLIANPMNKVNVKIVVNRNNTTIGYLDEPIKGNNNFVMKQ